MKTVVPRQVLRRLIGLICQVDPLPLARTAVVGAKLRGLRVPLPVEY